MRRKIISGIVACIALITTVYFAWAFFAVGEYDKAYYLSTFLLVILLIFGFVSVVPPAD